VLASRLSVYDSAVADAGGLLTATGIVAGLRHAVREYVALDATTLLVAEFLVLYHEGRNAVVDADYAELAFIVREWFPVRGLALDAATTAPKNTFDADSFAALTLAEALHIPLVTKNDEIRSRSVPVLRA
jgi:hypothetical protein